MHLVLCVVFCRVYRHHEAQGSTSVGRRGTCIWRDSARACSSSCSSDCGSLSAAAPLEPEAAPATSRSSDERGVLLASVSVHVDGCCHCSQLPCSTLGICNPAGTNLQTDGAHDLCTITRNCRRTAHWARHVPRLCRRHHEHVSGCRQPLNSRQHRFQPAAQEPGHVRSPAQNTIFTLMVAHRNVTFADVTPCSVPEYMLLKAFCSTR